MVRKIQSILILLSLLFFDNACKANDNEKAAKEGSNEIQMRGIVLYPSDLISLGANWWVDMLGRSGLNVLGIHTDTRLETIPKLKAYIESNEGKELFGLCREKGIDIEFELHVLQNILPRILFKDHPDYFRMDKEGIRQQQFNMCFSSEGAYMEIEKNLTEICRWLKPTTNRYFFWTDDVQDSFCHCEQCKQYSESEQALIYANRLLEILHKIDPKATVAHLAYYNTLPAPIKIKPANGVFLEYAPINRDYTQNLPEGHLQSLKDNLEIFPKETAHVLEYWLDASMFAEWNRDKIVKIPWKREYCERDIKLYRDLGVNSITTFGAWINSNYIREFGEGSTQGLINDYGSVLNIKR